MLEKSGEEVTFDQLLGEIRADMIDIDRLAVIVGCVLIWPNRQEAATLYEALRMRASIADIGNATQVLGFLKDYGCNIVHLFHKPLAKTVELHCPHCSVDLEESFTSPDHTIDMGAHGFFDISTSTPYLKCQIVHEEKGKFFDSPYMEADDSSVHSGNTYISCHGMEVIVVCPSCEEAFRVGTSPQVSRPSKGDFS